MLSEKKKLFNVVNYVPNFSLRKGDKRAIEL